jgi:poly-beta-1,6-N-acetyl-D-glucosamine biosynthesis protein PgaD
MTKPPDTPWPPLITAGAVSRLVRMRDLVLTVIAWFVLLYLSRGLLELLWSWISAAHPSSSAHSGPDWSVVWQQIATFIYLAVFVVLWLTFWAVVRRRDLRRIKDSQRAASISLEDLAGLRGLNAERLRRFQGEKIVVVHFDAEHRASSIAAVPVSGAGDRPTPEPLREP